MPKVRIDFTGDTSGFKKSLNDIKSQVSTLESGGFGSGILGGVLGGGAVGVGFAAIQSFISTISSVAQTAAKHLIDLSVSSSKVAANFEMMKLQLKTLISNPSEVDNFFESLKSFSAETPFELTDVVSQTQKLLNFGIKDAEILKVLDMLGNLALGDIQKLNTLSTVYGRTMSKGFMDTEGYNMMIDAGIPVGNELRSKFPNLSKSLESKSVKSTDIKSLFEELGTGSGKFAGAMKNMSETFSGITSTLNDAITELKNSLGEGINKGLKEGLSNFTQITTLYVSNIKLIGDLLGDTLKNIGDDLNKFLLTLGIALENKDYENSKKLIISKIEMLIDDIYNAVINKLNNMLSQTAPTIWNGLKNANPFSLDNLQKNIKIAGNIIGPIAVDALKVTDEITNYKLPRSTDISSSTPEQRYNDVVSDVHTAHIKQQYSKLDNVLTEISPLVNDWAESIKILSENSPYDYKTFKQKNALKSVTDIGNSIMDGLNAQDYRSYDEISKLQDSYIQLDEIFRSFSDQLKKMTKDELFKTSPKPKVTSGGDLFNSLDPFAFMDVYGLGTNFIKKSDRPVDKDLLYKPFVNSLQAMGGGKIFGGVDMTSIQREQLKELKGINKNTRNPNVAVAG